MKAKTVLACVVLLAAVSLAGCISKTGTGTGNNYAHRADAAPDTAVGKGAGQSTAARSSQASAK